MHSHRCDYSLDPVPADAECFCPGPGEEALPCGHLRESACECDMWDTADYE